MYILIYDILDVRFYEQYYAFSKVLQISFGAPFKDAKSLIERSITLRTVLYFYWFSAEYVYSLFHVFSMTWERVMCAEDGKAGTGSKRKLERTSGKAVIL